MKANHWSRWRVTFHHSAPMFDGKPVVVVVRARTAKQARATALRSKSTRLMVYCFGGTADNWEASRLPLEPWERSQRGSIDANDIFNLAALAAILLGLVARG